MAEPVITSVPKVSDSDILTFMNGVAEAVGAPQINIREVADAADGIIEATAIEGYRSAFADSAVLRIAFARLNYNRFLVSIDRNGFEGSDGLLYDKLTIQNKSNEGQNAQPVTDDAIRKIQDLISSTFGQDDAKIAGLFRNPKLFRDLLASHHRQNLQIQQTALQVGKQAAEARTLLEQEFARRKSNLEDELKKQEVERDGVHQRRLELLGQQEASLAAREKELDDRSNTHARRELHRELKARIIERSRSLNVTPETKSNRTPIHVTVIIISAILVITIFYWSNTLAAQSAGSFFYTTSIKIASLTIALLGMVAWYLRWLNRWFERYADTEFQLKQFELDIDRASWVVEAALEWKLSQDKPMPEHLLETISRNLFSKSEKDESADMHPADYLASAILGRASGLNVKVPGGEISLTGKDIRKLQNDTMPS